MRAYPHAAFSGYGVEIEYMIVHEDTLDVAPIADRLLEFVQGTEDMDVVRGKAAWSNELALHVIEVKTAGPTPDLAEARHVFREQVQDLNSRLGPLGARLMPGGMHPWMAPLKETRLWPHQNDEIYRAFDRIFGCHGHGWSNLQSTHINFPFSTPEEFRRLHAACRFVLPLIPALAASSPFLDGTRGQGLSTRLFVYRNNCSRIPSVTGLVVPERVSTEEEYQALLAGIYQDLLPYDPDGDLAHEWVNARGCIARFDRGAIEIRLVDAQESPGQDLAVVAFLVETVKALYEGRLAPAVVTHAAVDHAALDHAEFEESRLLGLLLSSAEKGQSAPVEPAYAAAFGVETSTMGDLLRGIAARIEMHPELASGLEVILTQGSLAERLVKAVGETPSHGELRDAYSELCRCLEEDVPFRLDLPYPT